MPAERRRADSRAPQDLCRLLETASFRSVDLNHDPVLHDDCELAESQSAKSVCDAAHGICIPLGMISAFLISLLRMRHAKSICFTLSIQRPGTVKETLPGIPFPVSF